jgi:hypothetical protein
MGKGLIISGGTDGLYQLQVLIDTERMTTAMARLTAAIPATDALIAKAVALIAATREEIAVLEANVRMWQILDSSASPKVHTKEIEAALKSAQAKKSTLRAQQAVKDQLGLKKAGLTRRIAYLTANKPVNPIQEAWCADLTTDLSGYVGTIEVPGEREDVYIQPGYEENAVYDEDRDGQIQPSISGTAAQVYYNLALLPGWQKWMPTFRSGEITWISGDLCHVTLDAASSSAQRLNVNQTATLANVPIEYMD